MTSLLWLIPGALVALALIVAICGIVADLLELWRGDRDDV